MQILLRVCVYSTNVMAIFISVLVFTRKRNRLFALTDAPIRKQECPRWNFIINMRTAGRLLNNSTVASRLAAMNFIDIN